MTSAVATSATIGGGLGLRRALRCSHKWAQGGAGPVDHWFLSRHKGHRSDLPLRCLTSAQTKQHHLAPSHLSWEGEAGLDQALPSHSGGSPPGFPLPTPSTGSAPTPRDALAPLTCLPDGAAVCASPKAKLVTEGRRPVGLAVAVLPVVTHLSGQQGRRTARGKQH